MTFIVHTQRKQSGIHFFYQVNARVVEDAFDALCVQGAIDSDETHVETFPVLDEKASHELLAILHVK
jgi:hypothetical protein